MCWGFDLFVKKGDIESYYHIDCVKKFKALFDRYDLPIPEDIKKDYYEDGLIDEDTCLCWVNQNDLKKGIFSELIINELNNCRSIKFQKNENKIVELFVLNTNDRVASRHRITDLKDLESIAEKYGLNRKLISKEDIAFNRKNIFEEILKTELKDGKYVLFTWN